MDSHDSTSWEQRYTPGNRLHWRGRYDGPESMRFHEKVKCIDLREGIKVNPDIPTYGFLGFACDAGIRRNQGRPGAAQGPDHCKEALANTPIPQNREIELLDLGTVHCKDDNLEASQDALGHLIAMILHWGIRPIVIGGGHEISWGHYKGIAEVYGEKDLSITNFDAHYDLRPLLDGTKGSSGTPFLQIARDRESRKLPFHYQCIGVQAFGNTPSLFNIAKKLHVQTVMAEDFFQGKEARIAALVDEIIASHKIHYVSLCLDVFSAAYAPGVSASQALGLHPWHLVPLIRKFGASEKIVSFDVGELSPPFDQDGITAQLAASMIATYIYG